jgi:hypothetical protein
MDGLGVVVNVKAAAVVSLKEHTALGKWHFGISNRLGP